MSRSDGERRRAGARSPRGGAARARVHRGDELQGADAAGGLGVQLGQQGLDVGEILLVGRDDGHPVEIGQPDVRQRPGGVHGDPEGAGVGEADVLAGEPDQAAGDVERLLPGLEAEMMSELIDCDPPRLLSYRFRGLGLSGGIAG